MSLPSPRPDGTRVRDRFFKSTSNVGTTNPYTPFDDPDGSGSIVANDFSLVSARYSATFPTADPTPPPFSGAPTNLSAIAISDSEITLSWTDNSSDETGFLIDASFDGTTFVEAARVGAGVGVYALTEAFANFAHYFRVAALGPAGHSSFSNTASATARPPMPDVLTIDQVTTSRVDLSWDVLPGLSYVLEWRANQQGNWSSVGVTGGTYPHTGLTEATVYEYRMTAAGRRRHLRTERDYHHRHPPGSTHRPDRRARAVRRNSRRPRMGGQLERRERIHHRGGRRRGRMDAGP